MADIPEPVRIALEDVTPVIAAAFANDICLIWSGEHRAYWVAGGNGYTTGAAYAGRWTIADAYQQTKHCDPTKQIAFERVDATRAAPPAMDREAVENQEAISDAVHAELWKADASVQHLAQTLRFLLDTARDYLADAPVGNAVHFAIEQADRALSTLSADAIRQGEGDIERAAKVADHYAEEAETHADMTDLGARVEMNWHVRAEALRAVAQRIRALATPASHASDGGKA